MARGTTARAGAGAGCRTPDPRPPPACLAIGGFDPSGGAGVLADCEAIAAVGARPLAVVTTIAAQSHLRFAAASPVPPGVVRAQIDALAGAYRVRAVKTGVLPTPRHVALAADALAGLGVPLVVDPVLGASRGPGLVDPRVAAA
ncbi:MAG: bifunctional hydroxymethylpyrimidine kinase/phosphomethylpyrimidine kinase, partial [Myxococcota bacterium]|nr:bifunctional hydroxymethylpyrimidine kinase/phosphomethylpyrimidine kinase [Myxococcota bacterium]